METDNLSFTYGSPALAKISEAQLTKTVVDLIRLNPKASQADIVKLFIAENVDDPEAVSACMAATCIRLYANIKRSETESPPPAARPARTPTSKEERKVAVAKLVNKAYSNMLEEIRTWTFAKCAKMGGGLTRLSKKGKPNEIVGRKLTDAQILKELK